MAAATLASATQVASASASRAPSDAAWSGGVDRDRLTRLPSWPQQGMGRRTARESVQGRGVPPSVSRHQLMVSVRRVRDFPGAVEVGHWRTGEAQSRGFGAMEGRCRSPVWIGT